MKILALIGSPRKGSMTDLWVDQILKFSLALIAVPAKGEILYVP